MLAVVLSRHDVREYDQIVSLYTQEEGRRDLLAKGVKKIMSKNAAHLEPCSVIEVGMAKGKEMDIVTSVQIEEYFPNIRKDYYKSLLALWVTKFIKQLFTSPERDERVFFVLTSWLESLNKQKEISPYILDALVLRLLGFLGFSPILEKCVECERSRVGDKFFFSPSRGGIVCKDCRAKTGNMGEKWYELDIPLLRAFESLSDGPWELFQSFPREKSFYSILHHLVYSFLQYHHETREGDWKNLAKLSNFFPIFVPGLTPLDFGV